MTGKPGRLLRETAGFLQYADRGHSGGRPRAQARVQGAFRANHRAYRGPDARSVLRPRGDDPLGADEGRLHYGGGEAPFRHLKELPKVLKEKFGGVLPNTVEELCELPGVGRKTANLTVAVGFDLPAICVDVHVHRICNWLELVHTRKPLETEMELRRILPVRYWKTWNSHLVSFGQTRCDPAHPKCGGCPIASYCRSPKKK